MNLNPAGWASRTLAPLLRIVRSSPNATVPVVAISEPVNSETVGLVDSDIVLVAKGAGATLAQVPDATSVGGNKRGLWATDWQKTRTVATQVASGNRSVLGGGTGNTVSGPQSVLGGGVSNTASGSQAVVVGGETNTASTNYSFIGGGQNNLAQTNTHSTVCGGSGNTGNGLYGFIGGGASHTISGSTATVCGGNTNIATSVGSTVCGGRQNTANGDHSFVGGGRRGTARSIAGYQVFPACDVPIADALGISQSALLLLGRQTTDATATVLTSNTSAAGTTNQVILPNNSAYSFSGEVIAGVTGGGNAARWTINGAIKRGANAASTTMVGTATVTMSHFDVGAAAWVVAVTADTTNGGIAVTVTGAASTTIRWVCKINTTEMTY
jgi:hypothetical protein